MKVTRIFGVVLFLHIGVIAALVVQPGCSTTQPPTANPDAGRAPAFAADDGSAIVPQERAGGLDSAFNAGIDDPGRFQPTRPAGDYSAGLEPVDSYDPLQPAPGVILDETAYTVHTVKRGDTLWGIAKQYGVTVAELYEANGLTKNSVLRVGQQVQVPGGQAVGSVSTVTPDAYQPSGYEGGGVTYKVRSGDTLSRIAAEYGTSVRAIKAANNLSSDMIRVGQELLVPSAGAAPSAAGGTTTGPAPASVAVSSPSVGTTVSTAPPADGSAVHVVQPGEYPGTIAARYGMTADELLAINGIRDPRTLQVGQQLKVRSGSRGPASAPAPAATGGAPQVRVIAADPVTPPLVGPQPEPAEEIDFDDPAVPEIPVVVEPEDQP